MILTHTGSVYSAWENSCRMSSVAIKELSNMRKNNLVEWKTLVSCITRTVGTSVFFFYIEFPIPSLNEEKNLTTCESSKNLLTFCVRLLLIVRLSVTHAAVLMMWGALWPPPVKHKKNNIFSRLWHVVKIVGYHFLVTRFIYSNF